MPESLYLPHFGVCLHEQSPRSNRWWLFRFFSISSPSLGREPGEVPSGVFIGNIPPFLCALGDKTFCFGKRQGAGVGRGCVQHQSIDRSID